MQLRLFKAGIVILLMIISALLGSSSRKDQDVLAPYLAQEKYAFSLLILAEESDYINQTYVLNEIVAEHPEEYTKAGVLTMDSREGKQVRKKLNIHQAPTYILLDHKKVILIQKDLQEFKDKFIEKIEESR